jgi:uncharacterized membrane protein YtjA (UPF0391 family)
VHSEPAGTPFADGTPVGPARAERFERAGSAVRYPCTTGLSGDLRESAATAIVCLEDLMLKWAIIFFIISVIAGFFGFTGVASGARTIAKVLFFIALAIFLVILIFGVFLGMLAF